MESKQPTQANAPSESTEDPKGMDVFAQDPHRRRIDKIHLSQHILPAISRCYTHLFLANSDHKAVIVWISPPHSNNVKGRLRVPTTFLQDDSVMEALTGRLAELPQHRTAWWEAALNDIHIRAFRHEKEGESEGDTRGRGPIAGLQSDPHLTHCACLPA